MKTTFTGKNYSITVADGTETINGHECYSGQLIITHPQGTEVFDTFQELVEAHPICEEARECNVYRVASHNRNNSPDGRCLCFSGTKFECDDFYNDLTHYDRVSDLYLFGDDEDSAVPYGKWKHAGCSC
jgi:hypothetical protein